MTTEIDRAAIGGLFPAMVRHFSARPSDQSSPIRDMKMGMDLLHITIDYKQELPIPGDGHKNTKLDAWERCIGLQILSS